MFSIYRNTPQHCLSRTAKMEGLISYPISKRGKGQISLVLQFKFLPWLLQIVLEHHIKPSDIAMAQGITHAYDKSAAYREQKEAIAFAVTSGSYGHITDVTFLYRLIK